MNTSSAHDSAYVVQDHDISHSIARIERTRRIRDCTQSISSLSQVQLCQLTNRDLHTKDLEKTHWERDFVQLVTLIEADFDLSERQNSKGEPAL